MKVQTSLRKVIPLIVLQIIQITLLRLFHILVHRKAKLIVDPGMIIRLPDCRAANIIATARKIEGKSKVPDE